MPSSLQPPDRGDMPTQPDTYLRLHRRSFIAHRKRQRGILWGNAAKEIVTGFAARSPTEYKSHELMPLTGENIAIYYQGRHASIIAACRSSRAAQKKVTAIQIQQIWHTAMV